jgi:uracil phosphoribosyltransferase
VSYYKNSLEGKPAKCIAMHLIVTPEYIRRVHAEHPDVAIYALRLDRGLSEPAVLRTEPGTRAEEEKGLNDRQYIVPGAGGVGEILNNAWV